MNAPAPAVRLSLDAMATRFEVALHGDTPSRLRAAGEEALAEIKRLDAQLSFYNPASEVSRINTLAAGGPVRVDPRVFRLVRYCAELRRRTEGLFDVAIVPLLRLWGFTGTEGRVPDPEAISRALEVSGMDQVTFDTKNLTLRFARPGSAIDLGAIAKGYAVECAKDILKDCGVTSALIHGGTSSVYGIGAPPGQDTWRVAIRDPRHQNDALGVVGLRDCALGVSAVHGKSFVAGGSEYGHVIDPNTGCAVAGVRLAAVTGPSATDCDALSTALLIAGEQWIPAFRERFPGYRAIFTPTT